MAENPTNDPTDRTETAADRARDEWWSRYFPQSGDDQMPLGLVAESAWSSAVAWCRSLAPPPGATAGGEADVLADREDFICGRLIDWIKKLDRKPAVLAFTDGPMRQVAYAVEMMLSALRRVGDEGWRAAWSKFVGSDRFGGNRPDSFYFQRGYEVALGLPLPAEGKETQPTLADVIETARGGPAPVPFRGFA